MAQHRVRTGRRHRNSDVVVLVHSNKTKYFVLLQFDEVCSENNEVNEKRLLRECQETAKRHLREP